jgi:glycosyltransferase involved in cell wall biosynthesis
MEANLPFVSVLIPTKNEEDYILDCLESFINQSYPKNLYEIIVIDDHSNDKTNIRAESLSSRHKETDVSLIKNQGKGVGEAYKTGLKFARGEIILRATAHIVAPTDVVYALVTSLMKLDKTYAGTTCNLQVCSKDSALSQVMVAFMTSLGGYGTSHYSKNKAGEIETGKAIMALRASVFLEIGGYPLGDDSELNALIKRAGFKFWLVSDLFVYYRYRYSTFLKHPQRMFKYGCIRAHLFKNYRESRSFFYMAPSIILVYLILTPVVFLFSFTLGLLLIITDIIALVAIGGYFSYKFRLIKFLFFSPLIIMLTYLSYGLGFLAGLATVNNS